MPFQFTKDRKTVLVSNGGVTVSSGATSFGVAGSAVADFPTGPRVFEVESTGESILVTAGFGTTTWSGITRGINGTTAANIPDTSVLLETVGANEFASFVQQGDAALTNVRSIKKTGASALTGDVTLTGGTNVTLTQSGQDISIAASGSVSDATTSAVGVVEVDHAPSGAHPVALTTDGVAVPSGMLGTASTKAAAGNDSRLSDSRTPTAGSVVDASVSGSAAIAESKLSLASDAAAGTASRRTLGTGATQATAGNDSRLSDTRTPTTGSVVDASVNASAAIAESKLSLASDAAAGTASRRTLGTGATQAAAGNDSRFATNAGETTATDFKATGLTGATAASRYVGGTASGAPVTGTFLTGDFIIDQAAHIYVCTASGSPGTWAGLTGGSGSSTLAGDTDVAFTSLADRQVPYYDNASSTWKNALLTTASIATGGIIGKLQLEYIAAVDLANGATLNASTFTDVNPNQNFTVDDANSTVMIVVSAGIVVGAVGHGMGSRVIVDSAGTPVTRRLGGGYDNAAFGNPLNGSGPVFLTGLSAGTHTVKVQLHTESTQTGGFLCRCSTRPEWEPFSIRVFEIKR